ncbi:hypothetical protein D3C72_2063750 [compost metagenome]
MGQHAMAVQDALDEDFQLASGSLLAEQARRDHPGVVEHHQVAGTQVFQQVDEVPVAQGARFAIQDEESAGAAFGQGMTGNQSFGKLEMEVGYAHGGGSYRRGADSTGNARS